MDSATATAEPRRIGGYLVGARIAVGGMAEVFLARRASDGAPRVLKVLLPRSARDAATVQGLAHEAELARALTHPGIVQAFELVTEGDVTALVLELVDGAPLDALLESGKALPVPVAVHVTSKLLEALAFVHAAKDETGRALDVVHRDVSPHNILVSREGDVKLVDFGIARSALRDQRTRTGLVKGKLQYLSPEQATGSEVDARTDVYAAGLVLYEMIAGAPFLRGESDVDVLRAAEAPSYVSPPCDALDAGLDRVLRRALARFPEERFASAKAFRAALTPFLSEEAAARGALSALVAAHVPERALVPTPRKTKPMRALVALAALGTTAALTFAVSSRPDEAVPAITPPRPAAREDASVVTAPAPPRALEDASVVAARPRAERDAGRREVVARDASAPVLAAPPRTIADAVLARRARLMIVLGNRGLSREDLGAESASAFAELDRALADADDARAEAALARLEGMAAAVRVDAQLVRRRMARIDARIAQARGRGEDVHVVEALSRSALEAFVEGRYDVANARIGEIERALAASP